MPQTPSTGNGLIIDSQNAYLTWEGEQQHRLAHPELYRLKSTGLRGLDRIIGGGMEIGNYVICAGQQKAGKSIMMQKVAQTAGTCKDPFAFFQLEMSPNQMIGRVICNLTGIDKGRIRRLELDELDWAKARAAGKVMEEWNGLWIFQINTMSSIKEVLVKYPDIYTVLLDHFNIMRYEGRGQRWELASDTSHDIQRTSRGLGGVPHPYLMVVAAQLNRTSIRTGHQDANALQGASALEQDADIILIVKPAKDDEGKKELAGYRDVEAAASRDTPIGKKRFKFNGMTADLADIDEPNVFDLAYWQGG